MNKKQLYQMYVKEKQSLRMIAKAFGITAPTVKNYLKKYDISTRSISEALKGRKLSEEHIKNRTKSQTGPGNPFYGKTHTKKSRKKISEGLSGKNHPNYGKKLSEETKAKIRQKHIGKKMSAEARKKISRANLKRFDGKPENHPLYGKERPDMIGENNPNWNGGATPLYKRIRETREYKNWRKACFERDNYTCCFCKQQGGTLHVDHIHPYSQIIKENKLTKVNQAIVCESLWNINNGRTLCVDCHKETPTFGRLASKN